MRSEPTATDDSTERVQATSQRTQGEVGGGSRGQRRGRGPGVRMQLRHSTTYNVRKHTETQPNTHEHRGGGRHAALAGPPSDPHSGAQGPEERCAAPVSPHTVQQEQSVASLAADNNVSHNAFLLHLSSRCCAHRAGCTHARAPAQASARRRRGKGIKHNEQKIKTKKKNCDCLRTEGDLAEWTRYKVTVLPKLQYWRVVSSECCGAGGAAYTSDAVDRHLCSLRVPCERERHAEPAAPAPAPRPPRAPAGCPAPPPARPFIYNTTRSRTAPQSHRLGHPGYTHPVRTP
ncbi:hypothetical protein SFRURICE_002037 [Spodoptera frugiperda]|nr:hypothetical protein SFRURICE_002037 [Spodoptera frugiperda]